MADLSTPSNSEGKQETDLVYVISERPVGINETLRPIPGQNMSSAIIYFLAGVYYCIHIVSTNDSFDKIISTMLFFPLAQL